MRVTITIRGDNAAFEEPGHELARLCRGIAERFERTGADVGDEWTLFDANGNRVGRVEVVK